MPRTIEINDFWAGIIGALLTATVLGAGGYAWSASRDQAVTQEKVEKLEDAKLPERMTKLETKMDNANEALDDVKAQQIKTDQKIDMLLMQRTERK